MALRHCGRHVLVTGAAEPRPASIWRGHETGSVVTHQPEYCRSPRVPDVRGDRFIDRDFVGRTRVCRGIRIRDNGYLRIPRDFATLAVLSTSSLMSFANLSFVSVARVAPMRLITSSIWLEASAFWMSVCSRDTT